MYILFRWCMYTSNYRHWWWKRNNNKLVDYAHQTIEFFFFKWMRAKVVTMCITFFLILIYCSRNITKFESKFCDVCMKHGCALLEEIFVWILFSMVFVATTTYLLDSQSVVLGDHYTYIYESSHSPAIHQINEKYRCKSYERI